MIRLDSTLIKLPFSVIEDIQKSAFIEQKTTKEGVLLSDKAVLKSPCLGVKKIEVDYLKEQLLIEFSAKVLKDQYFDLVNTNTIERCFDTFNSTGAIRLNVIGSIEQSEVLRCDVTKNLIMSNEPIRKYIDSLNHLRVNDKYKVEQYKQKRNNGIVFQGKQTSFKERVIFYDKQLDVLKDEQLRKEIPYHKLVAQFSNVLRCETNIVQLRKIRELVGSTNLSNLLHSVTNPNLFLFNKIKSKCINLELFTKYEGLKFYELEKKLGRQKIIELCSYDMNLVNQFIDSRVGGNTSKYKREYRKECFELLSDKDQLLDNNLMIEIENQLKVA